ncbi:hypothetical protein AB0I84_07370 [Streptomyces spectabilis]|uniref:hypothetical protein n=1 Tax=Streptomyces spectabilis TaxID=68270 RepID=UPI0033FC4EDC
MPEITYQAAWNPDEQEVTVIQNVRAGVSGPFGDWPAATRDDAERTLMEQGYSPAGEWQETRYGGHWVDLVWIGR